MTLDQLTDYIVVGAGTVLAALIAVVRGNDMDRIKNLEQSNAALGASIKAADEKLSTKIDKLRDDMDRKHDEVMRELMTIKGRQ